MFNANFLEIFGMIYLKQKSIYLLLLRCMRATLRAGFAGLSPLAGFAETSVDLKVIIGDTNLSLLSISSANICKTDLVICFTSDGGIFVLSETDDTSSFRFICSSLPYAVRWWIGVEVPLNTAHTLNHT